MRGFDDVLKEGFERHSRAVAAGGGVGAQRAQAMLGAIRRRRVLNTAVAATVTVVAAGALAASAVRLASTHPQPGTVNPLPTPVFHDGAFFEGPETAVFACGATLPSADQNLFPGTVETGTGVAYRDDLGQYIDYGSGGAVVRWAHGVWPTTDPDPAAFPGWRSISIADDDHSALGAVTFDALAWVDDQGRIIGREREEPSGADLVAMGGVWDVALGNVGQTMTMVSVRGNLASRGVPCDGIEASALENATIVFIQGAGPSADQMTWNWTKIWPPAN